MQASEQIPEKRMTTRLQNYWEKLKSDQIMPDFKRFNCDALNDVWGQCFVVQVTQIDPIMYQVEHVGQSVQEMFGQSLTGKMLSASIQSIPGATIIGDIDECVNHAEVVYRQGTFVNQKSKVVKYRSTMLPFSQTGEVVDNVVIGLSWRSF